MEFIDEFFHDRDGKFVLDCSVVECAEVHTKAPRAILFLDQENRS